MSFLLSHRRSRAIRTVACSASLFLGDSFLSPTAAPAISGVCAPSAFHPHPTLSEVCRHASCVAHISAGPAALTPSGAYILCFIASVSLSAIPGRCAATGMQVLAAVKGPRCIAPRRLADRASVSGILFIAPRICFPLQL
ncbi:hypothetical protein C8R46DRAFT_1236141 [Mycena filopes]|nr:hypothetical protein C8R46DRAFT_1236141 [Mycena filopes]